MKSLLTYLRPKVRVGSVYTEPLGNKWLVVEVLTEAPIVTVRLELFHILKEYKNTGLPLGHRLIYIEFMIVI